MKKIVVSMLIIITILCAVAVPGYADYTVSPRLNNLSQYSVVFEIAEDGTASIDIFYRGTPGVTTGATINSKIQKKVSGNWVDVDIDEPNNKWVDTSRNFIFSTTHTHVLTERGTYRAVVEFNISGNGGANDIFTETIEKTF